MSDLPESRRGKRTRYARVYKNGTTTDILDNVFHARTTPKLSFPDWDPRNHQEERQIMRFVCFSRFSSSGSKGPDWQRDEKATDMGRKENRTKREREREKKKSK